MNVKMFFLTADNKQLKELLKRLLEIVRKNYDIFCEKPIWNFWILQ